MLLANVALGVRGTRPNERWEYSILIGYFYYPMEGLILYALFSCALETGTNSYQVLMICHPFYIHCPV